MKNSARQLRENTDKGEREAFLQIIGVRVRQLRLQKQWTQEMLAQEAKISDKYVYDIENGKKCMSIWVLEKVCKALEADVSKLMKG